MQSYPATVSKLTIVKGASLARGTTIDEYLQPADAQLLYNAWKPGWPEPLGFAGGITAITCEMVLEVPEDEFNKAMGGSAGKRIYKVARQNASSI